MNQMFFGNSKVMLFTANGGSTPAIDPAKTRFTLQGGTVEEYDIVGSFSNQWMVDHDFLDEDYETWLKPITRVDIGNTVTGLQWAAFSYCSTLTSITFSDNITTIGDAIFSYCTSLTNITIPSNINYIGYDVFERCSALSSVVFQGRTLEQAQNIPQSQFQEESAYPWGISDTSIISVA